MNELIEAIRVAVADGATAEQKATGAQACHTILAALGAQPGKPIVLPGAPKPHPLSALSFDQALDLVIARLRTMADAREQADKHHPTGDGSILYRTLARVLVRQQIFANAIPENSDCDQTKAAG